MFILFFFFNLAKGENCISQAYFFFLLVILFSFIIFCFDCRAPVKQNFRVKKNNFNFCIYSFCGETGELFTVLP